MYLTTYGDHFGLGLT